jgi:hypothetical protein
MTGNNSKFALPDISRFPSNRRLFPLEELARYAGLYVAWSPDGTHILASGASEEAVEQQLQAAGIPPSQVIGEYIPPMDSMSLPK